MHIFLWNVIFLQSCLESELCFYRCEVQIFINLYILTARVPVDMPIVLNSRKGITVLL